LRVGRRCASAVRVEDTQEAALLDQTVYTQTALFALEVALYRLMESWECTRTYSWAIPSGELVAAHVSGVLKLEDACILVAAPRPIDAGGCSRRSMVTIRASEEEVLGVLEGSGACVAGVNGRRRR